MNSSTGAALFRLEGESVAYQKTVALKNITLQIGRGEKVALIGPSGAGKTTLLRALYERVADRAAFVHQHYALVPQLSAFHNVYIGRLDRHSTAHNLLNLIKPQKRIVEEILPILQALRMEEKIFEKVGALSGGQQQRVAVARAMYRGEGILLADEPISSVDPHQAGTVMELIMQNAETVIVSLHAVEFALKFAKRIIGLSNGEVQFDLPAEKVTLTMLKELYQNESM
ncbi:MAG: ATP-binding cassette domain-containing protein [Candidatus Poribacteria bacterium]|nr:ATP-binding cassette domain-containing protein [Candidatus Poribacteria bacterium]